MVTENSSKVAWSCKGCFSYIKKLESRQSWALWLFHVYQGTKYLLSYCSGILSIWLFSSGLQDDACSSTRSNQITNKKGERWRASSVGPLSLFLFFKKIKGFLEASPGDSRSHLKGQSWTCTVCRALSTVIHNARGPGKACVGIAPRLKKHWDANGKEEGENEFCAGYQQCLP